MHDLTNWVSIAKQFKPECKKLDSALSNLSQLLEVTYKQSMSGYIEQSYHRMEDLELTQSLETQDILGQEKEIILIADLICKKKRFLVTQAMKVCLKGCKSAYIKLFNSCQSNSKQEIPLRKILDLVDEAQKTYLSPQQRVIIRDLEKVTKILYEAEHQDSTCFKKRKLM